MDCIGGEGVDFKQSSNGTNARRYVSNCCFNSLSLSSVNERRQNAS